MSLLVSDIAWAEPNLVNSFKQYSAKQAIFDASSLGLPLDFCSVSEIYQKNPINPESKKPLIALIQDPHANFSGQENIAKTLELLMKQYGLRDVFVEGAEGDVTLGGLRQVMDPVSMKRLAKKLLLEAKISGEEYLNLTSSAPMKIVGVEDIQRYAQGLKAYARLAKQREKILSELQTSRRVLVTLKNRQYPFEILEYEKTKSVEGDKKVDGLTRLIQRAGTSLESFPQMQKLVALAAQEKKLDFSLANLEQAALIEELGDRKLKIENLGSVKNSSQAQLLFLEKIVAAAKENHIPVKNFPNLSGYQDYLGQLCKIDWTRLLEEQKQLEARIYLQFLQGENLDMLHQVDRYLELLESAYKIQMTSEEFQEYLLASPKLPTLFWQGFLNTQLLDECLLEQLLPLQKSLEEGREAVEDFYRTVDERDKAFIKNISNFQSSILNPSSKICALIVGGYHTRHLTQLLREKEYSYVVLSPKVTQETNWVQYEKSLLQAIKDGGSSLPAGKAHRDLPVDGIRKPGALLDLGLVNFVVSQGAGEARVLKEVKAVQLRSSDLTQNFHTALEGKPLAAARLAGNLSGRSRVEGRSKPDEFSSISSDGARLATAQIVINNVQIEADGGDGEIFLQWGPAEVSLFQMLAGPAQGLKSVGILPGSATVKNIEDMIRVLEVLRSLNIPIRFEYLNLNIAESNIRLYDSTGTRFYDFLWNSPGEFVSALEWVLNAKPTKEAVGGKIQIREGDFIELEKVGDVITLTGPENKFSNVRPPIEDLRQLQSQLKKALGQWPLTYKDIQISDVGERQDINYFTLRVNSRGVILTYPQGPEGSKKFEPSNMKGYLDVYIQAINLMINHAARLAQEKSLIKPDSHLGILAENFGIQIYIPESIAAGKRGLWRTQWSPDSKTRELFSKNILPLPEHAEIFFTFETSNKTTEPQFVNIHGLDWKDLPFEVRYDEERTIKGRSAFEFDHGQVSDRISRKEYIHKRYSEVIAGKFSLHFALFAMGALNMTRTRDLLNPARMVDLPRIDLRDSPAEKQYERVRLYEKTLTAREIVRGGGREYPIYYRSLFTLHREITPEPHLVIFGTYPPEKAASALFRQTIRPKENSTLLVIGAGSGADPMTAAQAVKGWIKIVATDIGAREVFNMRKNIGLSPYRNSIAVAQADLFDLPQEALSTWLGSQGVHRFDAIYFNIPWEESGVLEEARDLVTLSDPDGALLERFLTEAPNHLARGGSVELFYPEAPKFLYRVLRNGFVPVILEGTNQMRLSSPNGEDASRFTLVYRKTDPRSLSDAEVDLLLPDLLRLSELEKTLANPERNQQVLRSAKREALDFWRKYQRHSGFVQQLVAKISKDVANLDDARYEHKPIPETRVNPDYPEWADRASEPVAARLASSNQVSDEEASEFYKRITRVVVHGYSENVLKNKNDPNYENAQYLREAILVLTKGGKLKKSEFQFFEETPKFKQEIAAITRRAGAENVLVIQTRSDNVNALTGYEGMKGVVAIGMRSISETPKVLETEIRVKIKTTLYSKRKASLRSRTEEAVTPRMLILAALKSYFDPDPQARERFAVQEILSLIKAKFPRYNPLSEGSVSSAVSALIKESKLDSVQGERRVKLYGLTRGGNQGIEESRVRQLEGAYGARLATFHERLTELVRQVASGAAEGQEYKIIYDGRVLVSGQQILDEDQNEILYSTVAMTAIDLLNQGLDDDVDAPDFPYTFKVYENRVIIREKIPAWNEERKNKALKYLQTAIQLAEASKPVLNKITFSLDGAAINLYGGLLGGLSTLLRGASGSPTMLPKMHSNANAMADIFRKLYAAYSARGADGQLLIPLSEIIKRIEAFRGFIEYFALHPPTVISEPLTMHDILNVTPPKGHQYVFPNDATDFAFEFGGTAWGGTVQIWNIYIPEDEVNAEVALALILGNSLMTPEAKAPFIELARSKAPHLVKEGGARLADQEKAPDNVAALGWLGIFTLSGVLVNPTTVLPVVLAAAGALVLAGMIFFGENTPGEKPLISVSQTSPDAKPLPKATTTKHIQAQSLFVEGIPLRRFTVDPDLPWVVITEAIDEENVQKLARDGRVNFDIVDAGPEGHDWLAQGDLLKLGRRQRYQAMVGFVNHTFYKDPDFQKVFPDLKIISLFSRGTNQVDLHKATRDWVQVTNIGDLLTEALAEQNIAMMLEAAYDLTRTIRREPMEGDVILSELGLSEASMLEILLGEALGQTLKLKAMYAHGRSPYFRGAGVADAVLHGQWATNKAAGIQTTIALPAGSQVMDDLESILKNAYQVENIIRYTSISDVPKEAILIDPAQLFVNPKDQEKLNQSLRGKTLGIQGLGAIGKATARRALALGLHVKAFVRDKSKPLKDFERVELFSKGEEAAFFQGIHILTTLAPPNEETQNFVNEKNLAMMDALELYINTGRGELVDEKALYEYLKNHPQVKARLDVLRDEKKGSLGRPLMTLPSGQVEVAGHNGSAVLLIRREMQRTAIFDNLLPLIVGRRPKNPVNQLRWYQGFIFKWRDFKKALSERRISVQANKIRHLEKSVFRLREKDLGDDKKGPAVLRVLIRQTKNVLDRVKVTLRSERYGENLVGIVSRVDSPIRRSHVVDELLFKERSSRGDGPEPSYTVAYEQRDGGSAVPHLEGSFPVPPGMDSLTELVKGYITNGLATNAQEVEVTIDPERKRWIYIRVKGPGIQDPRLQLTLHVRASKYKKMAVAMTVARAFFADTILASRGRTAKAAYYKNHLLWQKKDFDEFIKTFDKGGGGALKNLIDQLDVPVETKIMGVYDRLTRRKENGDNGEAPLAARLSQSHSKILDALKPESALRKYFEKMEEGYARIGKTYSRRELDHQGYLLRLAPIYLRALENLQLHLNQAAQSSTIAHDIFEEWKRAVGSYQDKSYRWDEKAEYLTASLGLELLARAQGLTIEFSLEDLQRIIDHNLEFGIDYSGLWGRMDRLDYSGYQSLAKRVYEEHFLAGTGEESETNTWSKDKTNYIFLDGDNFLYTGTWDMVGSIYGEIYWRAVKGISFDTPVTPETEDPAYREGAKFFADSTHLHAADQMRLLFEKFSERGIRSPNTLEETIQFFEERVREKVANHAKLLEGAKEFLEALEAKKVEGYPIQIILLSHGAQSFVKILTDHLGIRQYFTKVIGVRWDQVGDAFKKSSEIVKEVKSDSRPKFIAMGGDSTSDIQAALEASAQGVATLAFATPTGPKTVAELQAAGADVVVENLLRFEDIFKVFSGEKSGARLSPEIIKFAPTSSMSFDGPLKLSENFREIIFDKVSDAEKAWRSHFWLTAPKEAGWVVKDFFMEALRDSNLPVVLKRSILTNSHGERILRFIIIQQESSSQHWENIQKAHQIEELLSDFHTRVSLSRDKEARYRMKTQVEINLDQEKSQIVQPFVLRRAEISDINAIADVWNKEFRPLEPRPPTMTVFKKRLRDMLASKPYPTVVFVAVDRKTGKVLGYSTGSTKPRMRIGTIDEAAVKKPNPRGLGSALIKEVFEWLKQQPEVDEIHVGDYSRGQTPTILTRLGFNRTGEKTFAYTVPPKGARLANQKPLPNLQQLARQVESGAWKAWLPYNYSVNFVGVEDTKVIHDQNSYPTAIFKFKDGNGSNVGGSSDQEPAIIHLALNEADGIVMDIPSSGIFGVDSYDLMSGVLSWLKINGYEEVNLSVVHRNFLERLVMGWYSDGAINSLMDIPETFKVFQLKLSQINFEKTTRKPTDFRPRNSKFRPLKLGVTLMPGYFLQEEVGASQEKFYLIVKLDGDPGNPNVYYVELNPNGGIGTQIFQRRQRDLTQSGYAPGFPNDRRVEVLQEENVGTVFEQLRGSQIQWLYNLPYDYEHEPNKGPGDHTIHVLLRLEQKSSWNAFLAWVRARNVKALYITPGAHQGNVSAWTIDQFMTLESRLRDDPKNQLEMKWEIAGDTLNLLPGAILGNGARLANHVSDEGVINFWRDYWRHQDGLFGDEDSVDAMHPMEITDFILTAVAKALPEYGILLDMGSGIEFHITSLIAQAHPLAVVYAMDVVDPQELRAPNRIRYFIGKMEDPKIPNDLIDTVLYSYSMDYAVREDAISEMRRILKPGGSAILFLHHPDSQMVRNLKALRDEDQKKLNVHNEFLRSLEKNESPDQSKLYEIDPEFTDHATLDGLFAAIDVLLSAPPAEREDEISSILKGLREDRDNYRNRLANIDRLTSNLFNSLEEAKRYFISKGLAVEDSQLVLDDAKEPLGYGLVIKDPTKSFTADIEQPVMPSDHKVREAALKAANAISKKWDQALLGEIVDLTPKYGNLEKGGELDKKLDALIGPKGNAYKRNSRKQELFLAIQAAKAQTINAARLADAGGYGPPKMSLDEVHALFDSLIREERKVSHYDSPGALVVNFETDPIGDGRTLYQYDYRRSQGIGLDRIVVFRSTTVVAQYMEIGSFERVEGVNSNEFDRLVEAMENSAIQSKKAARLASFTKISQGEDALLRGVWGGDRPSEVIVAEDLFTLLPADVLKKIEVAVSMYPKNWPANFHDGKVGLLENKRTIKFVLPEPVEYQGEILDEAEVTGVLFDPEDLGKEHIGHGRGISAETLPQEEKDLALYVEFDSKGYPVYKQKEFAQLGGHGFESAKKKFERARSLLPKRGLKAPIALGYVQYTNLQKNGKPLGVFLSLTRAGHKKRFYETWKETVKKLDVDLAEYLQAHAPKEKFNDKTLAQAFFDESLRELFPRSGIHKALYHYGRELRRAVGEDLARHQDLLFPTEPHRGNFSYEEGYGAIFYDLGGWIESTGMTQEQAFAHVYQVIDRALITVLRDGELDTNLRDLFYKPVGFNPALPFLQGFFYDLDQEYRSDIESVAKTIRVQGLYTTATYAYMDDKYFSPSTSFLLGPVMDRSGFPLIGLLRKAMKIDRKISSAPSKPEAQAPEQPVVDLSGGYTDGDVVEDTQFGNARLTFLRLNGKEAVFKDAQGGEVRYRQAQLWSGRFRKVQAARLAAMTWNEIEAISTWEHSVVQAKVVELNEKLQHSTGVFDFVGSQSGRQQQYVMTLLARWYTLNFNFGKTEYDVLVEKVLKHTGQDPVLVWGYLYPAIEKAREWHQSHPGLSSKQYRSNFGKIFNSVGAEAFAKDAGRMNADKERNVRPDNRQKHGKSAARLASDPFAHGLTYKKKEYAEALTAYDRFLSQHSSESKALMTHEEIALRASLRRSLNRARDLLILQFIEDLKVWDDDGTVQDAGNQAAYVSDDSGKSYRVRREHAKTQMKLWIKNGTAVGEATKKDELAKIDSLVETVFKRTAYANLEESLTASLTPEDRVRLAQISLEKRPLPPTFALVIGPQGARMAVEVTPVAGGVDVVRVGQRRRDRFIPTAAHRSWVGERGAARERMLRAKNQRMRQVADVLGLFDSRVRDLGGAEELELRSLFLNPEMMTGDNPAQRVTQFEQLLLAVRDIHATGRSRGYVYRLPENHDLTPELALLPVAGQLIAEGVVYISNTPKAQEISLTSSIALTPGTGFLPTAPVGAGSFVNYHADILLAMLEARENAEGELSRQFVEAFKNRLPLSLREEADLPRALKQFIQGVVDEQTRAFAQRYELLPLEHFSFELALAAYARARTADVMA